jgi:predicted AlkP superfamily phosphohydrolase/phosphomutase
MAKIVIIGLDGATFDLILPWVRSGELPHFAHLLRRGIFGRLQSTIPPMSPPAWNSFMTGVNPGKHGIFDFTGRKPQSYETHFINATQRRVPTLWRYLSEEGKRVAVLSVPFTYPPEHVNGVMISGFDAPGVDGLVDRSATYPPELYDELRSEVGEYPMGPNLSAYTEASDGLEAALRTMESKSAAAIYLYQKEAWDCFMFVLGETDGTSHRFWRFCDPFSPLRDETPPETKMAKALLTVYRKADAVIGRFLQLASQDTTIMVISDHGNGGNSHRAVYINRWLESQGWLAFKRFEGLVTNGLQLTKRLGLKFLPPQVKRMVYRLTNLPNVIESWARFSAIDWKRTQVYCEETPYFPSIWINLKGREPVGIVEPPTYESMRDRIMAQLTLWRNPYTAQPMVKRVYRREEIYSGPYVDHAPDLLIEWELDDGYSYLFRPSTGRRRPPVEILDQEERTRVKSGDHRPEGIFLATGPQVAAPMELKDVKITDVAPTILHILGLPVPSDMDGKVLTELFTDAYRMSHPIRHRDGSGTDGHLTTVPQEASHADEMAIRARLTGLGYIA